MKVRVASCILFILALTLCSAAQSPQLSAPSPDIHQLLREVEQHQKQLEKVRENYTYTAYRTIEVIKNSGKMLQKETDEYDVFFVNGHPIERKVKKNGQPLSTRDEKKETERVAKLIAKAQSTPSSQSLEGTPKESLSHIVEIIDFSNPRRVDWKGRTTLLYDFVGRKDAQAQSKTEGILQKLRGSIWIDEADRQIAHFEATFGENYGLGGGIVGSVKKGSTLSFDQAFVNQEVWLQTATEFNGQERVLWLGLRAHITERDFNYKRYNVDSMQSKPATLLPPKQQK